MYSHPRGENLSYNRENLRRKQAGQKYFLKLRVTFFEIGYKHA